MFQFQIMQQKMKPRNKPVNELPILNIIVASRQRICEVAKGRNVNGASSRHSPP